MKLQKFHVDNCRRYNGDMPPDVENWHIEVVGMAYDVQEVDREIALLETEDKRLREALNYYAEKKHYTLADMAPLYGTVSIRRVEDGEIARKALGGEG